MIEVDPNNDNILYVGGIDLFRSTNSSAVSWTQISKWSNNPGLNTLNVPFVHADQHAMTFRPGNSNQAIFGNDGGVYYASSLSGTSGNGNAISVRNNNYNVTQYVKAGIGPNGVQVRRMSFLQQALRITVHKHLETRMHPPGLMVLKNYQTVMVFIRLLIRMVSI